MIKRYSFSDSWGIYDGVQGMILVVVDGPQLVGLARSLHDEFAIVENVKFVFVEECLAPRIA